MKKYLPIFTAIIILIIIIVGLLIWKPWQNEQTVNDNPDVFLGNIIDVSDKDGQTVEALVGDKIEFTLIGINGKGLQWSARPLEGDTLELDSHHTENFVPMNKDEEYKSIWVFNIIKAGETKINFVNITPLYAAEPEDTYQVTIISTEKNENN